MAAAASVSGTGGGARLVDRCIDAAARGPATVEAWRRQRRSLERLPAPLADALFRRLAARRLLFPSLLEVFSRSVEEVDLSGFLSVDAEWLAYLGSFRFLRVLTLADCKNIDNDAVWSLSGMNTLKDLDLSRCKKISDAGIKHIVTIESLEKLHLSETELTNNGVMLISSLTNLSFLDLGGILMTDKSLQSLQVLTRLEHLDIWGSETTNEGASTLKSFARLIFLNLALTRVNHLSIPPTTRCLNMSNCEIHSICDEDSEVPVPLENFIVSAATFGNIDKVFSSIQASSLTHLDLSSCKLSNLSFLEKMKNLEHLDLSYNIITDGAIEHIAKLGTNLQYLSLKNTGITSQALCILAGTVPNLTSLSLANTKIDDSALAYIGMIPLLRTIDLSQTSIKGFTHMSAFEHLKYLESLNLEDTPLSAEVIPPLASLAALKYLYLKSDFLSDPALHALSAASNLIHLGFCGNILSSSGLLQFVPPTTLCVLDLSGCWILTGEAISTFRKRHPTIELRHELMEEVQANFVGGSQFRKPRRRQSPHVKSEVGNSFAGPSRLRDICFVDERIKYSKEEFMELQGLVKPNSLMLGVWLPPELRRSK
ncbi:uncharacterized protein LOC8055749 isoform X1 [Sorghum bicolor]|nr:uncharacterized protein LOC8055749 isoform X1 [Sorghum bicolor]KXG21547.1 hypothetical protein SORBI_3009G079500 [Sorghum bicolor]|eukprot:XP_021303347.1 uncharacterized protein LOC8055749 isoform X1 [Sorghum bicolor]